MSVEDAARFSSPLSIPLYCCFILFLFSILATFIFHSFCLPSVFCWLCVDGIAPHPVTVLCVFWWYLEGDWMCMFVHQGAPSQHLPLAQGSQRIMGVTRCLSHPRTQIHLDLKMNRVVSQLILGSCRYYWVLETVLSKNVTQWYWAGQCTGKCLSELDPISDRRKILVHKYLFMAYTRGNSTDH